MRVVFDALQLTRTLPWFSWFKLRNSQVCHENRRSSSCLRRALFFEQTVISFRPRFHSCPICFASRSPTEDIRVTFLGIKGSFPGGFEPRRPLILQTEICEVIQGSHVAFVDSNITSRRWIVLLHK